MTQPSAQTHQGSAPYEGLRLNGLTKRFGRFTAVEGVDLHRSEEVHHVLQLRVAPVDPVLVPTVELELPLDDTTSAPTKAT